MKCVSSELWDEGKSTAGWRWSLGNGTFWHEFIFEDRRGSHAYFWQVFWWIRLNQGYRFLRRGDKEWEQGISETLNAIDWDREKKINKRCLYRGGGGKDERQGGHGRKTEKLVSNWSSNERQGHWACSKSKKGNLGMTELECSVGWSSGRGFLPGQILRGILV